MVVSSEISLYKKPNGILSKFCPSETSKYIDNFSILDFIICSLLFIALTKEEKDDILDMDFTYENWKDKSFVLINNFIKGLKNSSPESIWFCFDDIYFVFHIEIIYQRNFSLKNIIYYPSI